MAAIPSVLACQLHFLQLRTIGRPVVEGSAQVARSSSMTLHFAAGCLRERAGFDQDDVMNAYLVLLGDCRADSFRKRLAVAGRVVPGAVRPIDFGDDHKPFVPVGSE